MQWSTSCCLSRNKKKYQITIWLYILNLDLYTVEKPTLIQTGLSDQWHRFETASGGEQFLTRLVFKLRVSVFSYIEIDRREHELEQQAISGRRGIGDSSHVIPNMSDHYERIIKTF